MSISECLHKSYQTWIAIHLTREVDEDCIEAERERPRARCAVPRDESGGCIYCASMLDLVPNKGRTELGCPPITRRLANRREVHMRLVVLRRPAAFQKSGSICKARY
jgi:hypothetical protein